MASPIIVEHPSPASETVIDGLEQHIGYRLPESYRAFLQRYNGGHPEPNAFPITNFCADTHGLLEWFFGIGTHDTNDLLRNYNVFMGRMPSEFLPFARDPGGNLLCFFLSEPNYGQVFYWDHETEASEDEEPTTDNLFFVAASFDELFASLRPLDSV